MNLEKEKTETFLLNLESIPSGWIYFNKFVCDYDQKVSSVSHTFDLEDANDFFNGTKPNFSHTLAGFAPRRQFVQNLHKEFDAHENKPFRIVKITGPGGEGKSTILQQFAIDLARRRDPRIHVIFREYEKSSLNKNFFDYLLNYKDQNNRAGYTFFIIADDAQTIASDIDNYLKWLGNRKYLPTNKIRFLLAARGTEWQWEKAPKNWSQIAGSDFLELPVRQLSQADALEIAKAWKAVDTSGKFNKDSAERLGDRLFYIAKLESRDKFKNQNSFYSAIFEVRQAKNLEGFITDMLERFEAQTALEGKNLKDCYKYIVALHGDGKHILTKPVLQRALGCYSLDQLKNKVIELLADEKVEEGNLILARHDVFAQNVKRILEDEDPRFLNKIVPELAAAAIHCFLSSEIDEPESARWMRMTEDYLADPNTKRINTNTKDLAIAIAKKVAEEFPGNALHVSRYGRFLHTVDELSEANNVFLEYFEKVNLDKGYFVEWGIVQGKLKHGYFNVILIAAALSDSYGEEPNMAKPWLRRFASLATAFRKSYDKSVKNGDNQNAEIFKKAVEATVRISDEKNALKIADNFDPETSYQRVNLEATRKRLSNELTGVKGSESAVKKMNLNDSFKFILDGFNLAWKLCEINKNYLPQKFPHQLEYSKLLNAFGIKLQNQTKSIVSLDRESSASSSVTDFSEQSVDEVVNNSKQYVFRKLKIGSWEIGTKEISKHLDHLVGFSYIYEVLRQPDTELELKIIHSKVTSGTTTNPRGWRNSYDERTKAAYKIIEEMISRDFAKMLEDNIHLRGGNTNNPRIIYQPKEIVKWHLEENQ